MKGDDGDAGHRAVFDEAPSLLMGGEEPFDLRPQLVVTARRVGDESSTICRRPLERGVKDFLHTSPALVHSGRRPISA